MFTRQHFEFIARTFKRELDTMRADYEAAPDDSTGFPIDGVERFALALAKQFKEANPAFRTSQFLTACGIDASKGKYS